jgi:hypothetical protein
LSSGATEAALASDALGGCLRDDRSPMVQLVPNDVDLARLEADGEHPRCTVQAVARPSSPDCK